MATERQSKRETLRAWLAAPVHGASMALFRAAFGVVVAVAAIRFIAYGWIERLYVAPALHFKYYGFEWVSAPPRWALYAMFGALALSGLFVAIGLLYRLSALVLLLTFTYIELVDRTLYLNHYYLVSVLAALLVLMPLGRVYSVDAWRRARRGIACAQTLPRWCLVTLQLQLGVVYFFAGVAKLQGDWLLRAEPLRSWLAARGDVPLVGAFLVRPEAPYLFAWGGALFDLLVPFALCWRRTRALAYAAVLGFHVMTWALFEIGIFPWVMIALAPIFFSPDWPRRFFPRARALVPRAMPSATPAPLSRALLALLALHFALQLLLPLRHHLYRGNHLWTDQGFRFSWHVMIIEKRGDVRFTVHDTRDGRRYEVSPCRYLTPLQITVMAGEPDLIAQLARHIRRDFERRGVKVARVTADAYASLNGRRRQRFIDPGVDLSRASWSFAAKPWIVPLDRRVALSSR
ncbi:MAG: HTTM domain-containing protein [Myxococcales bacterium]|nr:HTTM domain-containing protein [Myxococcales bacterium]